MTKEQADKEKAEKEAIQEFETKNGLSISFGMWIDNKLGKQCMYCGTFPMETVTLVDGKPKLDVIMAVSVRYIEGRGRLFSEKVWNSNTKMGEHTIRRFGKVL